MVNKKTHYTVFENLNSNFTMNNLNLVLHNKLITYKFTFKYLEKSFDST